MRILAMLLALLVSGCTQSSSSNDPPLVPQYIPSTAHKTIVVVFNEVALTEIAQRFYPATVGSRAYEILDTCMYDAWSAYQPRATSTVLPDFKAQGTSGTVDEAVAYAAYDALKYLFPTSLHARAALAAYHLAPYNGALNITAAGIGQLECDAVIEQHKHDGSNQRTFYRDTTHYHPVNSPLKLTDPNHWQPLVVEGYRQWYTTPQWGSLTSFALDVHTIDIPGPPFYGTQAFRDECAEMVQLSANLTDRQKAIANYWSLTQASVQPPGRWLEFGAYISRRDHHTLDDDVPMFFALSSAIYDAGIAVWHVKRLYDSVRPISAVRYLYAHKKIRAWGGYGRGTMTIDGSQWEPYQEPDVITPGFPEYVSGHSGFSAAAAYVLRHWTGSDRFGWHATIAKGSLEFDPGQPHQTVRLEWPTFTAAADEAGMSRRYGGIHFKAGDLMGRRVGEIAAAAAYKRAISLIEGY